MKYNYILFNCNLTERGGDLMPRFYERRIGDRVYRISYVLNPFEVFMLKYLDNDEFLKFIHRK